MTEFGEYKYIIKKFKDPDGGKMRWKVDPDPSNPSKPPVPKSSLHWEFEKYEEGLEAHFQFCHSVPEKPDDDGSRRVCFIASEQINEDWAASIPDHMGSTFLAGTLRRGVPPKKSMYYAVWIVDPNGPDDYAIGDNPPPRIDTGPG